jgi:hypothetical protein
MNSCRKAIIIALALIVASASALMGANAIQVIGGDISKAKIYDANGKRYTKPVFEGIDEQWVVQTQETDLEMTSSIATIRLRQNSIFKVISLYSEVPTILLAEGACDITTTDLTYPLIVRTPVSSYTVVSNASFHILSNAQAEIGYSNDSEVIVTNNITGRISLLKKATLMEFQDWAVIPTTNIAQAFEARVEDELYTHDLKALDYSLKVVLNSGLIKLKQGSEVTDDLLASLKSYVARKGIGDYVQSFAKQGDAVIGSYPSSMANSAIISSLEGVLTRYLNWLFAPTLTLELDVLGIPATLKSRSTDIILTFKTSPEESLAILNAYCQASGITASFKQTGSVFTTDSDQFDQDQFKESVSRFNLAYRLESGQVLQNPLFPSFDLFGQSLQTSFYFGEATITYPSSIKPGALKALLDSFSIEGATLTKSENSTLLLDYKATGLTDAQMIQRFSDFIESYKARAILYSQQAEAKAEESRKIVEEALAGYLDSSIDIFELSRVIQDQAASGSLVTADRPVALIVGPDRSAGIYIIKTDESNMPVKVYFDKSDEALQQKADELFAYSEQSDTPAYISSIFDQRIPFLGFDAILTAPVSGQLNLIADPEYQETLRLFALYIKQAHSELDFSMASYDQDSGITFLYASDAQITEIAQLVALAAVDFEPLQKPVSIRTKDIEIKADCQGLEISFDYSLEGDALSSVASLSLIRHAVGPCTVSYADNSISVVFDELLEPERIAKALSRSLSDSLSSYKDEASKLAEAAQREEKRSQFADICFNSDPEYALFSYAFSRTRLPVVLTDAVYGITARFDGTYNFTTSIASNFLGIGATLKPYYSKGSFAASLGLDVKWNPTDGFVLPFKFDFSSAYAGIASFTRYISVLGYGYKSDGFSALLKESQEVHLGSSAVFADSYPDTLALTLSYNKPSFKAQAYLDDARFSKLLSTVAPQAQNFGLELSIKPLMEKDFEASFSALGFGIINTDNTLRLIPAFEMNLPFQGGKDRSSMLLAFGFDSDISDFKFFVQAGFKLRFSKADLGLGVVYNKGSRFSSLINMTGKDKLFGLEQTTMDLLISFRTENESYAIDVSYDLPLVLDRTDVVARLNSTPDTARNINWSADLFSIKAAFYHEGISLVLGYGTFGLFSNFEGFSSSPSLANLVRFAKNCLIPEYMNLFADARLDFDEFALGFNVVVRRYSANTPTTVAATFYTELGFSSRPL